MIDYIVIGILVVIIAAAAFYVYKAKKSGKKCISMSIRQKRAARSVSAARMDALAVPKRQTSITAAAVPMRNRKDAGAFRLDGPR